MRPVRNALAIPNSRTPNAAMNAPQVANTTESQLASSVAATVDPRRGHAHPPAAAVAARAPCTRRQQSSAVTERESAMPTGIAVLGSRGNRGLGPDSATNELGHLDRRHRK